MRNPNPAEAEAVEFGIREGVPVDAATATGNPVVRGFQWLADRSPLGGQIGQRARQVQAEALAATGNRLATRVHEVPIMPQGAGEAVNEALARRTEAARAAENARQAGLAAQISGQSLAPEQAAEAVRGRLEGRVTRLDQAADEAYGTFYRAAEDPANVVEVQAGMDVPEGIKSELDALAMSLAGVPFKKLTPAGQTTVMQTAQSVGMTTAPRPVMKTVAMPVDMRLIKAALKPLYEDMTDWMEPAKRSASAGYTAVKSILEGDDIIPATRAEKGLSGLKELAREGKYARAGGKEFTAAMRDTSQGIGANAVAMLQDAVDQAAARAGGDVLAAVRQGRMLTAAKYDTADLVKSLRTEPVQLFQQLTWGRDTGIALLREVAKKSPDELPKIGRALVDDLWSRAQTSDKFSSAQNTWKNLGPETKNLLFKQDPQLIAALDDFFGKAGEEASQIGKFVKDEPVNAFNRLVEPKDASIERLRTIQKLAPQEIPKIGRSWLEQEFKEARGEGGFNHSDRLWSDWQNLGTQTKTVLFGSPSMIRSLDNFFLLAKKIAENPNPSGSALVGSLTGGVIYAFEHPQTGVPMMIGAGALAKLLHSPRGAQALMNGLRVPLGNKAARAIALNQILRVAGDDAQPMDAAAERSHTAQTTAAGQQ
ncbi:MAG: hypothetical protein M1541_07610 [Acidobacteria bacterium]|nr:hypothetical protein [Acidobacteriota bacterium]